MVYLKRSIKPHPLSMGSVLTSKEKRRNNLRQLRTICRLCHSERMNMLLSTCYPPDKIHSFTGEKMYSLLYNMGVVLYI